MDNPSNKKNKKFLTAKEILMSSIFTDQREKAGRYVHHEFQDYGYRLAVQLGDLSHKSLYIRLAKKEDRNVLNQALSFSKDYPKAQNKGKIFMWKLKELKQELKDRKEQAASQNKDSQVKLW